MYNIGMPMKTTTAKKKKPGKRKKMATAKGRPPKTDAPENVELGLRGTREQRDFIMRGAELEAKRLNIYASRNNFCLRACLRAAQVEIDLAAKDSKMQIAS